MQSASVPASPGRLLGVNTSVGSSSSEKRGHALASEASKLLGSRRASREDPSASFARSALSASARMSSRHSEYSLTSFPNRSRPRELDQSSPWGNVTIPPPVSESLLPEVPGNNAVDSSDSVAQRSAADDPAEALEPKGSVPGGPGPSSVHEEHETTLVTSLREPSTGEVGAGEALGDDWAAGAEEVPPGAAVEAEAEADRSVPVLHASFGEEETTPRVQRMVKRSSTDVTPQRAQERTRISADGRRPAVSGHSSSSQASAPGGPRAFAWRDDALVSSLVLRSSRHMASAAVAPVPSPHAGPSRLRDLQRGSRRDLLPDGRLAPATADNSYHTNASPSPRTSDGAAGATQSHIGRGRGVSSPPDSHAADSRLPWAPQHLLFLSRDEGSSGSIPGSAAVRRHGGPERTSRNTDRSTVDDPLMDLPMPAGIMTPGRESSFQSSVELVMPQMPVFSPGDTRLSTSSRLSNDLSPSPISSHPDGAPWLPTGPWVQLQLPTFAAKRPGADAAPRTSESALRTGAGSAADGSAAGDADGALRQTASDEQPSWRLGAAAGGAERGSDGTERGASGRGDGEGRVAMPGQAPRDTNPGEAEALPLSTEGANGDESGDVMAEGAIDGGAKAPGDGSGAEGLGDGMGADGYVGEGAGGAGVKEAGAGTASLTARAVNEEGGGAAQASADVRPAALEEVEEEAETGAAVADAPAVEDPRPDATATEGVPSVAPALEGEGEGEGSVESAPAPSGPTEPAHEGIEAPPSWALPWHPSLVGQDSFAGSTGEGSEWQRLERLESDLLRDLTATHLETRAALRASSGRAAGADAGAGGAVEQLRAFVSGGGRNADESGEAVESGVAPAPVEGATASQDDGTSTASSSSYSSYSESFEDAPPLATTAEEEDPPRAKGHPAVPSLRLSGFAIPGGYHAGEVLSAIPETAVVGGPTSSGPMADADEALVRAFIDGRGDSADPQGSRRGSGRGGAGPVADADGDGCLASKWSRASMLEDDSNAAIDEAVRSIQEMLRGVRQSLFGVSSFSRLGSQGQGAVPPGASEEDEGSVLPSAAQSTPLPQSPTATRLPSGVAGNAAGGVAADALVGAPRASEGGAVTDWAEVAGGDLSSAPSAVAVHRAVHALVEAVAADLEGLSDGGLSSAPSSAYVHRLTEELVEALAREEESRGEEDAPGSRGSGSGRETGALEVAATVAEGVAYEDDYGDDFEDREGPGQWGAEDAAGAGGVALATAGVDGGSSDAAALPGAGAEVSGTSAGLGAGAAELEVVSCMGEVERGVPDDAGDVEDEWAVELLQGLARGVMGRRRAEMLASEWDERAATSIQSHAHGALARRRAGQRVAETKRRVVAATRIQSHARGMLARRRVQSLRIESRRRQAAAVLIQKHVRGYAARKLSAEIAKRADRVRKEVHRIDQLRQSLEGQQNAGLASEVLERGLQAREAMREMEMRLRADAQVAAAIKIQAFERGRQARRCVGPVKARMEKQRAAKGACRECGATGFPLPCLCPDCGESLFCSHACLDAGLFRHRVVHCAARERARAETPAPAAGVDPTHDPEDAAATPAPAQGSGGTAADLDSLIDPASSLSPLEQLEARLAAILEARSHLEDEMRRYVKVCEALKAQEGRGGTAADAGSPGAPPSEARDGPMPQWRTPPRPADGPGLGQAGWPAADGSASRASPPRAPVDGHWDYAPGVAGPDEASPREKRPSPTRRPRPRSAKGPQAPRGPAPASGGAPRRPASARSNARPPSASRPMPDAWRPDSRPFAIEHGPPSGAAPVPAGYEVLVSPPAKGPRGSKPSGVSPYAEKLPGADEGERRLRNIRRTAQRQLELARMSSAMTRKAVADAWAAQGPSMPAHMTATQDDASWLRRVATPVSSSPPRPRGLAPHGSGASDRAAATVRNSAVLGTPGDTVPMAWAETPGLAAQWGAQDILGSPSPFAADAAAAPAALAHRPGRRRDARPGSAPVTKSRGATAGAHRAPSPQREPISPLFGRLAGADFEVPAIGRVSPRSRSRPPSALGHARASGASVVEGARPGPDGLPLSAQPLRHPALGNWSVREAEAEEMLRRALSKDVPYRGRPKSPSRTSDVGFDGPHAPRHAGRHSGSVEHPGAVAVRGRPGADDEAGGCGQHHGGVDAAGGWQGTAGGASAVGARAGVQGRRQRSGGRRASGKRRRGARRPRGTAAPALERAHGGWGVGFPCTALHGRAAAPRARDRRKRRRQARACVRDHGTHRGDSPGRPAFSVLSPLRGQGVAGPDVLCVWAAPCAHPRHAGSVVGDTRGPRHGLPPSPDGHRVGIGRGALVRGRARECRVGLTAVGPCIAASCIAAS